MASRSRAVGGRQHHLGLAPGWMPVWGPDGEVTLTRTSAAQLREMPTIPLRRLAEIIRGEMTQAAAARDYETASQARDELTAVDAELARR